MDAAALQKQIDTYLPDKHEFYKFCIRKKLYLPDETASIVTIEFLDLAFRGICGIPKMNQVHPISIADPPTKDILKSILLTELKVYVDRGQQGA